MASREYLKINDMDTRTGNLYSEEEMNRFREELERGSEDFVKVDPSFATKMQLANKKVNLKDHRSKLGKQLTKERRIRNFNSRRK